MSGFAFARLTHATRLSDRAFRRLHRGQRPPRVVLRRSRKRSPCRALWLRVLFHDSLSGASAHTALAHRIAFPSQKNQIQTRAINGKQPVTAIPKSNDPVLSTSRPKYLCAGGQRPGSHAGRCGSLALVMPRQVLRERVVEPNTRATRAGRTAVWPVTASLGQDCNGQRPVRPAPRNTGSRRMRLNTVVPHRCSHSVNTPAPSTPMSVAHRRAK